MWSAVIAAALLALAGSIGTYFLGLWPTVVSAFSAAWLFLGRSSEIPHWVVALLLIAALPTVLLLLATVWAQLSGGASTQREWTDYTSDAFFGLPLALALHWRSS